jgi:hypothetical protein
MVTVRSIEISCLEVWNEVSNYIEGDLSDDLRRRIEEHLKVCEHCIAIVDGTRNVLRLVADGRTYDLPNGFSERLRSRLEKRLERDKAD